MFKCLFNFGVFFVFLAAFLKQLYPAGRDCLPGLLLMRILFRFQADSVQDVNFMCFYFIILM